MKFKIKMTIIVLLMILVYSYPFISKIDFSKHTAPNPSTRRAVTTGMDKLLVSETRKPGYEYIGNRSSGKFHISYCSSVADMYEENKVFESKEYLISHGYIPCKRCEP